LFHSWVPVIERDSVHIDKENFDPTTRDLTHKFGQLLVCNGKIKHWLFRPRRYRLYGLIYCVMAASTTPLILLLAPFKPLFF
jgi:hypothetical protein